MMLAFWQGESSGGFRRQPCPPLSAYRLVRNHWPSETLFPFTPNRHYFHWTRASCTVSEPHSDRDTIPACPVHSSQILRLATEAPQSVQVPYRRPATPSIYAAFLTVQPHRTGEPDPCRRALWFGALQEKLPVHHALFRPAHLILHTAADSLQTQTLQLLPAFDPRGVAERPC